ncbi:M23 family metallopeptidase [bacterium]|nr:M23 family metallopeptidase [bacterium]
MKKLTLCFLFVIFAVPLFSAEPDAKQILEKALTALGGVDNLEKVQTKTGSAKVTVAGLSGTYHLWAKSPDKMKMLLDLGVLQQERGYDGAKGWQKQTNLQELAGDDLVRLKRTAKFNPLLDYYKSGTPMELKGKEKIDNAEAYRIDFKVTPDLTETFFFDTTTFLPIRELRPVTMKGEKQELRFDYADYRPADNIKLPFSIIQTLPGQVIALTMQEYTLNADIAENIFHSPVEAHENEPYDVTLATIPQKVYKQNDGVFEEAATGSWTFYVVLKEKFSRPVDLVAAKIEFYSDDEKLESLELSDSMLETIRGISFGGFNNQEEIFDLHHYFSRPVSESVDKMVYKLNLVTPKGEKIQRSIDIPVETYEQKTELLFPIKGKFMVGGGHDFNEPHKAEWSQHYAYDIIGLGPHYEVIKTDGSTNEDFYTFGMEIISPADGKVTFARNDVPDNKKPGEVDSDVFMKMSDPIRAFPGNNVIIDHGNGEFSFLAHMKMGSVRVKTGDTVKAGQVIGLLGNSGNSDGPHLHYHFMAGPTVFKNDGLPSKFKNVEMELLTQETVKISTPKRGLYLVAK